MISGFMIGFGMGLMFAGGLFLIALFGPDMPDDES